MENFIAHNPTALHFGKNVLRDLGSIINIYGKKVLLVYGKESVKKSGLYDQIIKYLQEINCEVYEISSIKPNPIVQDVAAAAGTLSAVDQAIADTRHHRPIQ